MTYDRLSAVLADRYRIERELGAGGMATVYLAHDIKHDRKVAVKVLRPELAAVIGAERFLAEIKTTANLQHPHILSLFDSGTIDGTVFYVMPFVDGESLRDKLTREKQLPVDESLRISREVADALQYAHEHGVIHRDIKPENILLQGGHALVADFGIALAAAKTGGGRMTETGMSLGTPTYMSPEQAMGERDLDARTDIYALGCVTYEMLAGEPPFTGPTAQAIVAKVVTEPAPSARSKRATVPDQVDDAIRIALQKTPADRFRSAAEFAAALVRDGRDGRREGRDEQGVPSFLVSRLSSLALLAIAIIVALWGWLRPRPELPVIRYALTLPATQAARTNAGAPVPSPDGSFLVYVGPGPAGDGQLWLKRRDSYLATAITGTAGAASLAISPDGQWIAFVTGPDLEKVSVAGGAAVTLVADSVAPESGVAWLDDGTIVYVVRGDVGLNRIAAAGGASTNVWRSDTTLANYPVALPGSRTLLFSTCHSGCPEVELWGLDLRTKRSHLLIPSVFAATYAPTGHIIYGDRAGDLFAMRFDPDRLTISGTPIALGEHTSATYRQNLRVSPSGTLISNIGDHGAVGSTLEMVWVDRAGRETPVDTGWKFQLTATAVNHGWSLSPDGSRLAIGVSTDAGDDIWVKPIPAGAPYRLTYDPASDFRPHWTADSRYITFLSSREPAGLYQRSADATGRDSLLLKGRFDEGLFSPDHRWLLLRGGATGPVSGGRNITGLRLGVDTVPIPVISTQFDEEAIAPSPDGKWIAYQSDETGRTEVFVRPFPNVDAGKKQVSSGGGIAPLWSRDSKELYFLSSDKRMMAAKVIAGATVNLSEPVALFRVPDELLAAEASFYTPWDVAKDGRFLMVRETKRPDGETGSTIVVENWIRELRAKVKK